MENAHEDDVHCVLNICTSHADPVAVTTNLDFYLVTGGADKKVHVWDLRKMDDPKPLITLELVKWYCVWITVLRTHGIWLWELHQVK